VKIRKKRVHQRDDGDSGHDAFLDIVANLVGILVILVMVIGVRAQDVIVESSQDDDSSNYTAEVKAVEQLESTTRNLTLNVHEIQRQAERLEEMMQFRQQERQQMLAMKKHAERELEKRREQLDEESRKKVELDSKARSLARALDDTQLQRSSLEKAQNETITLEHVPTPLAKTVFGQEEHFQLKGGYLTYVPMSVLTDQLKAELPRRIERLRQVPEIIETIGPVQGFHLRYTVEKKNYATVSKAGPVVRQVAEFKGFELLPMSDQLGEPIQEALSPNSQFAQLVESLNPRRTVVTVWTYPDSFGKFRDLKRWLYDRGFACAARPLPDDHPISGSPQGSRSAAQ